MGDFISEANRRYGKMDFPRFNDRVNSINEELLGCVLVFTASHLARYRPREWRKVIDGADEGGSKMHRAVMKAYGHYAFGLHFQYVPGEEKTLGLLAQDASYFGSLVQEVSGDNIFLRDAKEIIESAQDAHWLQHQFNGSFAF